jgi:hypothetical protein
MTFQDSQAAPTDTNHNFNHRLNCRDKARTKSAKKPILQFD